MTVQNNNLPPLRLARLAHGAGLELPSYETGGAAGMDLRAAVSVGEPLTLKPGERALVPTGFVFEVPAGYEAQIRPRSGLAIKNGITCLNSPGTVDSDYRGEVKVILANLGQDDFVVERGMRIAQMVVARHETVAWDIVDSLDDTARGAGGFGSTGTRG